MATKNYFISCKNHRIDSGFTDSDFNPTQQRAELEGAGATIVNDFDNIDGGFYEIQIDDSNQLVVINPPVVQVKEGRTEEEIITSVQ